MINLEKYNEILNNGLLLDHYFVLLNIKNGVKMEDNRRIQGRINLLTKKGYLFEEALTEKANDLLSKCEEVRTSSRKQKADNVKADHQVWAKELHERLQKRIVKLTGKKQVRARFNGTGKIYSFLPNDQDLGFQLAKAMTQYKISDREKIEETLLKYIESSARSDNWFPILDNYIFKDKKSKLITDMDDEQPVENVSEGKRVDPNELF